MRSSCPAQSRRSPVAPVARPLSLRRALRLQPGAVVQHRGSRGLWTVAAVQARGRGKVPAGVRLRSEASGQVHRMEARTVALFQAVVR